MNRFWAGSRRAIAAALIASTVAVPAMAGEIRGTVSDASRTRALQAAQVELVELGRTAVAGRDGSFRFSDVPAGTYTLRTRYIGAENKVDRLTVAETGTARIEVLLGGVAANEVLVIGQTASQASALSRKRAADGVEDVLTRDAIGQFPDQNVAESLRRLPGVNVLNDQGEGRFVSVRGLDPELNATSVNGVRLPAPESDVRSVALDVVSSETIESIEVKKSLTPDMDADTIGASVEIHTASAFDRKKPLYKLRAEGSYNEYSGDVTPKISGDVSTRLTDDFGVSASASYYKRKFETDNIESEGWDVDGGALFADTVEFRDYDVERERFNASLGLDLRVDETTTLYARGIYSQFDDHEYRRRLTFELDEAPTSGDASSAAFDSADGEITVQRDLKDRFESQKIRSVVLGGETESDGWNAQYAASWAKSTETEHGSLDPARYERVFDDSDTFGVSFDYGDPRITRYTVTAGQAAFLDPAEYAFDKLERTTLSASEDEEYAIHADLGRTFATGGGELTLQAGGKIRWRTKQYDADIDVFKSATGFTMADGDILGGQTYRLTDLGPVIAKGNVWRDFFESNPALFELDDGDTFEGSNADDYRADEDIYAAYALGRWESDMLRVIGGVRMEHTKNDLRGNLIDIDNSDLVELRYKRSYTNWLPSLTVRFAPTDALVLRAAGSRSVVRPKLSNLAPRAAVEDEELEIGNPDLKPYEAWNLDLSAEYYFSRSGGISAGFFYKDVKNYVAQYTDDSVSGSIGGRDYNQITTYLNGEAAEIYGFEASYSQVYSFLPAPFDGLLTQLNYSYTDATGTVFDDGVVSDPRKIALPSSSKHTFNVVLGYEKGPLSLRAAGTYRSKYLDEIADTAEEDRYVDQHFQLDLSAKFRVTERIRIFGEWINVNDARYFAYQNFEGGKRLLQYERYGPTVKFGVIATY